MTDRRIAIVTGGARGIGLATGRALAASGWGVVLSDRDAFEPALEADFDCRRADVSDSARVDALVSGVVERYGRLDGLVTAAGYNRHAAVEDLRDEDGIVVLLAEEPDEKLTASVRKAAKLCPALAITIRES